MHYLAYNEGKQHGTSEFPVAYYYINKEHPRYNMPFHWHKEWEIVRILQGEFTLYADGETYFAKEGDILLLSDGMLHGGTPYNCIYECLSFDLRGLFSNILSVKNSIRPFYRGNFLPIVFYENFYSDVYPIVDELLCSFSKDMPDDICTLTTLGNLSRLFAAIRENHYYTENTKDTFETTRKITQIKPVLEYIEANFAAPLTLTELAGVIGMNPKYFCSFFHSITQQTPMQYVNYYRIEQAQFMLSASDLSIVEIGLECGFCDSSHFVKTFKKYKEMTPSQYRRWNT